MHIVGSTFGKPKNISIMHYPIGSTHTHIPSYNIYYIYLYIEF